MRIVFLLMILVSGYDTIQVCLFCFLRLNYLSRLDIILSFRSTLFKMLYWIWMITGNIFKYQLLFWFHIVNIYIRWCLVSDKIKLQKISEF